MSYPPGDLTAQDEQDLAEAEAPPADLDDLYPKPTQGDIEQLWGNLQSDYSAFHETVIENREIRYGRDKTPAKWAAKLSGDRRFRCRISHNEILRVAATLGRNPPKVIVPPEVTGVRSEDKAKDKADAQTQFGNKLLSTLERQARRAIWRPLLDSASGDGLAVLEVFMLENSVYDRVDFTPQEVLDPKTGEMRPETSAEVNKRVDAAIAHAPLPFGVRRTDCLAFYGEPEEEGQYCRVLIAEMKPYRPVFENTKKKSPDARLPKPGTPGWPTFSALPMGESQDQAGWSSSWLVGGSQATENVLTLRYYDKRWYMYIVGGVVVEGPVEHHLPGVPVATCEGITTGSSNLHERAEGVTHAFRDLELIFNDLVTLATDEAYTYNRPRPVVETSDPNGAVPPKGQTLDLSGGDRAPYLEPGQKVVDAFAGFKTQFPHDVLTTVLGMLQRLGMNPIAQGASPGSDPTGYAVNSLTQGAISHYEVILDNYARLVEWLVDFSRKIVRDVVKERVLGLDPEDVTDEQCVVTVDPLSDTNRLAMVQSYAQLHKDGYISRRSVQMKAGIDNPNLEDDNIVIDAADEELAQLAIETAKGIVAGTLVRQGDSYVSTALPQAPPQDPNAPPPVGGVGAVPPVRPPGVGGPAAAASQPPRPFAPRQGASGIEPSTARAGTPAGIGKIGA